MSMIRKVVALAFLVALAVNGYLMATDVKVWLDLRHAKSQYGLPAQNRPNAPFLGFDVDGRSVEVPSDGRGMAIWYASRDCSYCKRDTEWAPLAAALQQRGLRVFVLLPGQDHRFAPEDAKPTGATQVAFISREWLMQFPLIVTPTVLIFDGSHRLVWYKRGTLSAEDSANALHAAEHANPQAQ